MRVIKSLIRSLVASPKQQYYDPTTDLHLDLSYITPNIIVTSAPVSSYIESWYRYPLDDLLLYLNSRHGENWHLFNFRGEGPGYSYEQVSGKVSHYPFPDHYPPTMEIIRTCVNEMDDFLNENSENVAVLHCKAGKGRSGTLCCAYLIYQFQESSLEQILDMYTSKRMNSFAGEGISIKSQKRYLKYWYDCVHSEVLNEKYLHWELGVIRLVEIRINGVATSNVYNLGISIMQYVNQNSNTVTRELLTLNDNNCRARMEEEDWTVYKLNHPLVISAEDVMIRIKTWCYLWFNIFFESGDSINGTQRTRFTWDEFDGFKGTSQRGSKAFDKIEIIWKVN